MAQQRIQSTKVLAWVIWTLGALFFFYEFLLQIAPGVMKPQLMEAFKIDATEFGILGTFYFIGYGSMQIPAGVLLDRFGPRRLLTLAAAFCAVGTIAFALASNIVLADIARLATGLGSAFAMLGALILAANWFPINRFALLHGFILTIGILGAVFAGAPLSLLVEQFDWRPTMLAFGLIGLVLMLLIWLIIRDRPAVMQRRREKNFDRKAATKQVLQGLVGIIKNRQTWLTALYGGLMYGPTLGLAYWGPSFISLKHDIDVTVAAGLNSIMFIGWAIGSPMFGGLSDFLGRRKVPLYISSLGTLISILLLLYLPINSLIVVGVLMFLFGFFTCGFVPSFSLVREQHSAQSSGTALGFMNTVNSTAAGLAPPAIGILLDYVWQGTLSSNDVRVYSIHEYQVALLALPISLFSSLLILPFIKETFCRTQDQDNGSLNNKAEAPAN